HEGFDEALYPVVARTPGVAVASPVVEVETRVPGRNFELTVLGVDLLREWQLRQVTTGGRDDRLEGLWFFEPQNAMLSAQAARALNVDVEDRVTIQVGAEPVTFTVKSILTDDVYSGA